MVRNPAKTQVMYETGHGELNIVQYISKYPKYCSVTDMLLQLGVPSINTVLHNASWRFLQHLSVFSTRLVRLVSDFACS